MSKNLVIFDCDGVLVDSEFLASKVFSEVLTGYGYEISLEDCIRKFTGLDEHACRQVVLVESGISLPSDYWALHEPGLLKVFETELTHLVEPVLKLLDILKIPRCIASNNVRSNIIHSLELTNQMKYFSEKSIFTSQQVAKPKPAPDLFLFAANEMRVRPENCIVVEDSSAGARAAIAAGMQVLMFVGGSHARFEWYKERVSVHNKPMLSTPHELEDAIQNLLNDKIIRSCDV